MKTPICDFVKKYIKSGTLRLHMPGHKGKRHFGMEKYDLTEMYGADSLFEADGIIAESEKNASELFGADTFYSAEGSSLCIRAMLFLASLYAKERNEELCVLAARNVHKTFLSAAALLDFHIEWLWQDENEGYLSCKITGEKLEKALSRVDKKVTCVYITSPDYLGNICDIKSVSEVCRKYGILLLVDNAHGAYLKFLKSSMHPMDLGADMCCDSAHKTLTALTGGAYLHISKKAEDVFKNNARDALCMFASTSPSYLILQSLDYINGYIDEKYKKRLNAFLDSADEYKSRLAEYGYTFEGGERLKYTVNVKEFGYTGTEFADILRKNHKIECEFSDADYVVLMLSCDNMDLKKVYKALLKIPKRETNLKGNTAITRAERIISPRTAMLGAREEISVDFAEGRILAAPSVSCPPAVPILMPGERIDREAINAFNYYGIKTVKVVK